MQGRTVLFATLIIIDTIKCLLNLSDSKGNTNNSNSCYGMINDAIWQSGEKNGPSFARTLLRPTHSCDFNVV